MKPYFKIKRERYAEIWAGNLLMWTIVKSKIGRDERAFFNCPGGEYQKDEARAFVKACVMGLNFADVPQRGGGGKVKTEFNDGLQWFYFNEPGGKFVTHDGKFITVSQEQFLLAPEVRRYSKVVGTAVDFKFPKASKRFWRWS